MNLTETHLLKGHERVPDLKVQCLQTQTHTKKKKTHRHTHTHLQNLRGNYTQKCAFKGTLELSHSSTLTRVEEDHGLETDILLSL